MNQTLHAVRLVDGVEVFALDVFDQRHRRHRVVGHFAHQHRHLVEPRHLRGAPAAFTGDNFMAARDFTHQDRLHQPLCADGIGQFLQRLAVHLGARLVFAGHQLRHIHHAQVALRRRRVVFAAQQRIEAAPESLEFGHYAVSPVVMPARLSVSSASSIYAFAPLH